jgi:hypothetical protein
MKQNEVLQTTGKEYGGRMELAVRRLQIPERSNKKDQNESIGLCFGCISHIKGLYTEV